LAQRTQLQLVRVVQETLLAHLPEVMVLFHFLMIIMQLAAVAAVQREHTAAQRAGQAAVLPVQALQAVAVRRDKVLLAAFQLQHHTAAVVVVLVLLAVIVQIQ
jgi:hypothetical protein